MTRTSASERIESARKAVARFDQFLHPDTLEGENAALAVRDALADFITQPADRPSQEQMLRWLGIEHRVWGHIITISQQEIEREDS